MSPDQLFAKIVESEVGKNNVELGKMMSAPGIRYKNKNYAFYHQEAMCFKLGKEFNIDNFNISSWSHLSPFKTKPPLTAWYIISASDLHVWEELTTLAFKFIKEEIG